jgi:hypothetical protein
MRPLTNPLGNRRGLTVLALVLIVLALIAVALLATRALRA